MSVVENLDQLFEDSVEDANLERDAAAFPTAPTGQYNVQVAKITPVVGPEGRWDEGKKYARLYAPIQVATETGTRTLGGMNFNVSPERYLRVDKAGNETGDLDDMSKNYGQLKAALRGLEVEVDGMTAPEIIREAASNPIRISVSRTYKTDEGWRSLKEGEDGSEREISYKKAGFEVRNFLRRILTYKDEG
jgi:hypothetical protein